MQHFENNSYAISSIRLAIRVKAGSGELVHKNRPSHGIVLNSTGIKRYCFSDGRVLTVGENEMIFLPQHSDYFVEIKIDGDCWALNFEADSSNFSEPFHFVPKNHMQIQKLFEESERAWERKTTGYTALCMSNLYRILYIIQSEAALPYLPQAEVARLTPAIRYIEEYYTKENISIEKLAGLCNISEVYFRRIFRTVYGNSPLQYINLLKIRRAEELIFSQMYSLGEVADAAGFQDYSYFSREFKKKTGFSPRAFANLHSR